MMIITSGIIIDRIRIVLIGLFQRNVYLDSTYDEGDAIRIKKKNVKRE